MSRGYRWLNQSTDDVHEQLVRAARETEPSLAARERLFALLRRGPATAGAPRARLRTRLIATVLGSAASAAAAAPAAGKGLAIGATLSVVKWAGVGAIVGLSSVGIATRAGLMAPSGTRDVPTEAPVGPNRIAPNAPPVSHGHGPLPPLGSSDESDWVPAPTVASAVVAPPGNSLAGAVAEPVVPLPRLPVANPVAARAPNSGGPTEQLDPSRTEPGGTDPASSAAGPLPTPTAQRGATLADEVAALDAARASLRAGDAGGALRVLADYREKFPQGALADEASLVGITAWLAMSRRDAASTEAERLLARKPPPALQERVRKLMDVR